MMTNHTTPLQAAFHDAVIADAAFESFNASSFVVSDPERLFSLSNRAIDARDKLAATLAEHAEEDIALHGYTLRGRLITLNQSAQQPGKLQLTRFDQNGEPWGDTQYDSPKRALKEFLDEIEIATLQDIEQSFSPASRPIPDFIEVGGAKRSTRASNGRMIHHTEAGIRNFWTWYGNTGLTDEAGRPTVFYHGTHKDFPGFSEEKLGSTTKADWATLGHFFTPSPDLASKFSKGKLWDRNDAPYRNGANVIPAFVALRNPMRVPASRMLPLSGSEAGINRLLSDAKALGHDGIIIGTWKESFGTEDPTGELALPQYIAFSGSQIKSALGNDGAFSAAGNDLLFSHAGTDATHSTEGIPLAFHNRSDGNTYFIADNISAHASDAALKGLLRHELGLHALKTGRHQKDWEHLLSEIAKLRDEGDRQVLSAWKKARAAGTEEHNMLEETAGYLVQDAPDSSIGRKILSWFKSAVQRVTRIKFSLTSADIAEMAQGALNKAPRLLMRQNRDESDLVKDANGTPLRVFRGQHGPDDGSLIQTRLGAISFGSAGAAFTYASIPNRRHDTAPNSRITAAYLRITNPFINTPDDPFVELAEIEDKLGHAEATRIALKFADAILNTDNWYEIAKETGLASVAAFLKTYPDRVRDLYFDAYLLLDDVQEVEKIKDAGYDGAIHGGNGETALEAEYKVFSADQIVSPETVKIESLISPDARTVTETGDFRSWFGASKVVDNDGSPLILYHGTNESFDAFDWDRSREDGTVFASPNQRVASDFALYRSTWGGANVMPVYVRADNLLDIDGHGEAVRKVEDSAKFDDMKYGETVREYARRKGFDGIVFRNVYDDVGPDIAPRDDVWAFFESAQIKSAIGNSGAYDRNSNNILFSKAPSAATNTAGFRTWFGKSKAVDETGKPLVVFRGDRPEKTVFTGREDASAYLKGNIFFSSNPAVAKYYVKPRPNYMRDAASLGESDGLYRVHLSMQNPLVVDAKGESWSEIPLPPELAEEVGAFRGVMQIDDLATEAQRLGHDGLLVKNVLDQFGDGDQYVVFSPEQIKSAVANNGEFDRSNPNIQFSRGEQRHGTGMTTETLRARLAGIFGSDFVDGLEASGKVKFITAQQAEVITGDKMHAFAGPASTTADKIRLEAAQRRHEAGEHPENIRRETGWFRGVDGKWRYEISDDLAELDESAWYADSDVHGEPCRKMIGTLGDVMLKLSPTAAARLGYSEHLQKGLLQHAALLAAYPKLAAVEIEIRESNGFLSAARGHFRNSTPPRVALNINPSLGGSVIGALTHEIQHGIQAIEQFAQGGSPTDYSGDANRLATKAQIEDAAKTILEISASPEYLAADRAYADAGMTEQALERRNADPAHSRKRTLSKNLQALLKEVGLPMNARIIRDIAENGFSIDDIPDLGLVRYMRLAGEAEARNAEARRSLTPDERRTTAPATTCDTPEEDQIVLHHRMSA